MRLLNKFATLSILYLLNWVSGVLAYNATFNSSVITYPVPSGVATRNTFSIKVRPANSGAAWQTVDAFEISLQEVNINTGSSSRHKSSVASFDFSVPVEIEALYNTGSVQEARIRPDSYGLTPTVAGSAIRFTLSEPRNIVLQVNGDIFDCLHLFSNPVVSDSPKASSTNVIYFGPGLHTVPGNSINVTSGQTLYLASGAVLQANINFYNVSSASIRGHGALANPGGGITIEGSTDILVEDVLLLNPSNAIIPAVSDRVTVRGVRSLSSRQWGDGIDVYSSTNVYIHNIFMRNSDDCIAIYNHRWNWYGDNRNITVEAAVLWADIAHPINIGTHGNTPNPEVSDQISFRNIDILDHREYQIDYQGAIAINAGDSNLLTNIEFNDVRVEDFRQGQLINLRVMYNKKYNTSPGRGIQNVTFNNLSYKGSHANLAVMSGYNESATIDFVTFKNLTMNGKLISDTMQKPGWYKTSDFVPMYVNEHVNNLTFIN